MARQNSGQSKEPVTGAEGPAFANYDKDSEQDRQIVKEVAAILDPADPLDDIYPPIGDPKPAEELPPTVEPPFTEDDAYARLQKKVIPLRQDKSPMNEAYMKQMTSMMIMANLFNSSTGRNVAQAARTACEGADALWAEWIKDRVCAVRK
jgi:hypothetical protein